LISDGRFFLGKLKVVQVALGKDEESTATRNSYLLTKVLLLHIAKHCKGERGLLFTNKTADQVEKLFA
jgi:mRNA turnover protein 4